MPAVLERGVADTRRRTVERDVFANAGVGNAGVADALARSWGRGVEGRRGGTLLLPGARAWARVRAAVATRCPPVRARRLPRGAAPRRSRPHPEHLRSRPGD